MSPGASVLYIFTDRYNTITISIRPIWNRFLADLLRYGFQRQMILFFNGILETTRLTYYKKKKL